MLENALNSSEENSLSDVPCSSLAAVHMMSLLKVQVNDVIHTTTKPPRDKLLIQESELPLQREITGCWEC